MPKHQIVPAGKGKSYDWSKDHVYVKSALELSDGRLTFVEDHLKPGFALARHHHKKMIEIFYVLEGAIDFVFDDERVTVTKGRTVNVPPNVWHGVHTEKGATLLTIFSPGGFDKYLEELVSLTESQYADAELMARVSAKYDIFEK